MSIYSLVPDATALLELEPEELAGVLMEYLNSLSTSEQENLSRHNFLIGIGHIEEYPREEREDLKQAFMEAWVWLEHEGLLVPKPGSDGWVVISRRGRRLRTSDQVSSYRHANLLPRNQLHPRIAQKVWAMFLRGDYDTAVFQAFKEVEVRVRGAAQCADTDLGVDLMRKTFGVGGLLTDAAAPKGEQEALAHLFAGAIGSYKNPHSHRSVTIEPEEAVEMIMLASHLLGIVDKRSSKDRSD